MARSGTNHKGGQSSGGIGDIINGTDLARTLGVSAGSVRTYVKQGMPIYDNKGLKKAPRYDSAMCIRWLRDREIGRMTSGDSDSLPIEEIRRRAELAKMKKEEIELAVLEEKFGSIEAILEELSHCLATVRANLISLPKFSAQLEHQDSDVIEKRLEDEVYRMLEELSEFTADDE